MYINIGSVFQKCGHANDKVYLVYAQKVVICEQ